MLARTVETACGTATRIVTEIATKRRVFVLPASRDGREMYVQMVRVATLVEHFSQLYLKNFQLKVYLRIYLLRFEKHASIIYICKTNQ